MSDQRKPRQTRGERTNSSEEQIMLDMSVQKLAGTLRSCISEDQIITREHSRIQLLRIQENVCVGGCGKVIISFSKPLLVISTTLRRNFLIVEYLEIFHNKAKTVK